MPQLIEQLEIGLAPKADVQLLMKQAEAFAEGDPDAESLTSQSLRTPALVVPPAPDSDPAPSMDPVLADIFVKEMRGHLAVMRDFLAATAKQPAPYTVVEPLYRACHTLLGSARMAGFAPVMTLAAPLAEHLGRHFEAGSGLTAKGIDALRAAAGEIERLTEGLAGGRQLAVDLAVPKALDALAVAPPAAPAAVMATAESAAAAPPAAFDPEIAAIFAEEAAEILDQSETALQSVRQNGDAAAIVALQRYLHTLKGGARMAGIMAMGDLSHALETLLARVAGGKSQPIAAAIDLVQRGLDRLQQMRDAIDAGRGVEAAVDLVAQLEGFEAPAAPVGAAPAEPAVSAPTARAPVAPPAPPVEPAAIEATNIIEVADLAEVGPLPGAADLDVRAAAEVVDEPTINEPFPVAEEPREEPTIVEPRMPTEPPHVAEPVVMLATPAAASRPRRRSSSAARSGPRRRASTRGCSTRF